MLEAARIGDQVSHSSAFAGLILGALAGAVIGAAIVATGGAAALAIAGAACTGASLGGMLGELVGSMITANSGPIITGSPTVHIGGNGKQAAIACGSKVACVAHKLSMVAQGSATVFIEGLPAARKTDKGTCAFVIAQGCSSVFIGGPVTTCAPIGSEVPWQAEAALLILGLAGGGLAMAAKGLGMAAIAARLGGGLVGGIGGAMGGHWAGGKLFGEGSFGQKIMTFGGGIAGAMLGEGIAGRFVPGQPLTTAAELEAQSSRVYRVQGGELPKASYKRITIGENGEMQITGSNRLYVTFDDFGRASAFRDINRPGGEIVSFEVDPAFVRQVRSSAVPQAEGRASPEMPQTADPTRTPNSFGLPEQWFDMLKNATRPGSGRID